MDFHFSVYSTLLLFGFVQAWIYSLLLWLRGLRQERLADLLLGGVLVALAFEVWVYMLGFAGIEILWQELNFLPRTLGFLLPPLVYFYLRAQFDRSFRFRGRHLVHLLPFVVHTGYRVAVYTQGADFVRYWETMVHYPLVADLEFVVRTAQQLLYLYWSFRLYRGYRGWVETQFSDTDAIDFRWYRNFLIALTAALFIDLFVTLLDFQLHLTYWQEWWNSLAGVVLIYYVSIAGYAQGQVATTLRYDPTEVAAAPAPAPETVRPPSEALRELHNYMDREQPYLDADLSLPKLARRLHTNPSTLSRLINTETGVNFNAFVNTYRVGEFKRRATGPAGEALGVLAIALDCGFNSKATFNRVFKQLAGESPKQFIKRMRPDARAGGGEKP